MADSERPSSIAGGCLCGAVRYKIECTNENWPFYCSSCQCTMCRKWLGSLVGIAFSIPLANLSLPSPDSRDGTQLRQFESTPGTIRQFCGNCGSSLTHRAVEFMPDTLELWIGTLDEEVLIGKLKDPSADTASSERPERIGGWGQALIKVKDALFWGHKIDGVTDVWSPSEGQKWWNMIREGKPFV